MPRSKPGLCAAAGCTRMKRPWSAYCVPHTHRDSRYGHPLANAIRTERYEQQHKAINDGLERYASSKPVSSAKVLAGRVLHFSEPASCYWPSRKITAEMARLRAWGVTEVDLLRRVTAFRAYVEFHPQRSQKSEDYQLARAVLRLAPMDRGAHPAHRLLRDLGEMLRDNLYPFAFHFLRRMEADAEETRQLKLDCVDFDSITNDRPGNEYAHGQ